MDGLTSTWVVVLSSVLAGALRLCTPIAFGALGGVLSERSGVINIALEGIMVSSAFVGLVFVSITGQVWVGLVTGMVTGVAIACLLALLTVTFRSDQIITGMALNILAFGATAYGSRTLFDLTEFTMIKGLTEVKMPWGLSEMPIVGTALFNHSPLVYLMLISVVAVHLLLFKTKFGLWTRACGEQPAELDAAGINVFKVRYVNVLLSGLLASLGGLAIVMEVGNFTERMSAGKGWIALAAMIFGKWTPVGAFGAALLFGFADALQMKLQVMGVPIARQFLLMIPYILTIAALAGVVGRSTPPAYDGKPYVRGE